MYLKPSCNCSFYLDFKLECNHFWLEKRDYPEGVYSKYHESVSKWLDLCLVDLMNIEGDAPVSQRAFNKQPFNG